MKKQVLLLLVAIAAISCGETNKKKSDKTNSENKEFFISGNVKNSPNGMVTIFGSEFEKDVILEEDGSFETTLELPYSGYYNAIFGRTPIELYLEQGKDLALDIDLEQIKESLSFSGELDKENQFLFNKKEAISVDYRELFSEEPKEFTKSLKDIENQLNSALEEEEISNSDFLESQKREFFYQRASLLNSYEPNHTYLKGIDEVELPSGFYDPAEKINLTDTLEYRISNGYKQLVLGNFTRKSEQMPLNDSLNESLHFMKIVNEKYPESFAKNDLLKEVMGYGLKPDKHLDEVYDVYMENQTDPELKQQMEDVYAALNQITPGKDSPTFNYENFNGGTTSLEDLKGKYVYIDVWATWCVPCLNEIPYLKEVAKDYEGKNIEFVGISIDEDKAYDKWKNMVEEKELAGVQLYSGGDAWNAEFAKGYRVQSIPRFILIDPEGKIYDADTYRPSDKKLRELFDEIL